MNDEMATYSFFLYFSMPSLLDPLLKVARDNNKRNVSYDVEDRTKLLSSIKSSGRIIVIRNPM